MSVTPQMIDAMLAAGVTREQMAAIIKADLLAAASAAPQTVTIPPAIRQAVIARDGFVCVYCLSDVLVPNLDHVLPRSRGGLHTVENLVVSCRSCNAAKKDRTPQEWGRP